MQAGGKHRRAAPIGRTHERARPNARGWTRNDSRVSGGVHTQSPWLNPDTYRRATARNAAAFLDKLVRDMPFEVKAIQVDGGSEFKAEFERECRKRGIALRVLPPRSPKPDGNVERAVGTWRYEFHGCWDIPDDLARINLPVDAFADEFNRVRPHRSLDCRTPEEFLRAAS